MVVTTTGPAETFRFRAGAGRLCLDFVRTLRRRATPQSIEELPDADALADWIRQFGPAADGPAPRPDQAALAWARGFREAVYALLTAARGAAGVGSCPAAARDRVNQMASLPVPTPSLDAAGRLRWQADDPVSATLALIARDALDLVSSAALARVRECADPSCSALFLDGSRPGTRRWCSMEMCGNRAKKDTLRRARARAATPDARPGRAGSAR